MSIDKIKQFDQNLIIANKNQVAKNKMSKYISLIIVVLLFIFEPATSFYTKTQSLVFVVKGIFIFTTIHFDLCPYIYIYENRENISIYKKLKYLPINLNDVVKARWKYLKKSVLKIMIICLIAHSFSCIYFLHVSNIFWIILYPVIIVLIFGVLGGYLDIIFYKLYEEFKSSRYLKNKRKKIETISKIVSFIVICIIINRSLNFGDKRFLVKEDYSQIIYNDQIYVPIDIPDEIDGDVICERATVEGQGVLGLIIDSSTIYDVKGNNYLLRLKNDSIKGKNNYYCLKSKLSEVRESMNNLEK